MLLEYEEDEDGVFYEAWNDNQTTLYVNILGLFKPPEDLLVSEWAEKYFVHDKGTLRLIPFQREVLDVLGDDTIEFVTWKKSARVGATMSMVIFMVYVAGSDPRHIIMLQPTDDDARGISTDHVGPSLERCPETNQLFSAKSTRNTLTHKVFPGGSIKLLAAKSPRNLRRHDADILLMDEVDGYETTVEGDPVLLAIRRTQNSSRRKIYKGSTPTLAINSEITKSYEDSDKRVYKVPCPECGHKHTLEIENFHIDGQPILKLKLQDIEIDGDWEAHFVCPDCGGIISERKKKYLLDEGEWVATAPFAGHAGFFINTFYSPFENASWQKLAVEYLQAKRAPDTLQTFWNTVLGLEWSATDMNVEESVIMERRTSISMKPVPQEVLLLTAGVDIQKDRAEITILGWNETQTWTLAHDKIYGDPTAPELWAKLDDYFDIEYQHELGDKRIYLSAIAIDSGNWTNDVYQYCAGREMRGIYAIKGVAGQKPIWTESKIRPGSGAKLYNVGVDTAKVHLMSRLATVDNPSEDSFIHFSDDFDLEYVEQLLSEYRKIEYVAGRPKYTWERRSGRRAEALDCWVYALAARQTLSPNWDKLYSDLAQGDPEDQGSSSGLGGIGKRLGG